MYGGVSDRTGGCGRGRIQDFSEGVLKVRPHTKSGGGGGGGGGVRFRSDALFGTQKNTLSLMIHGYNFDRGGCSMVNIRNIYIYRIKRGGGGGGGGVSGQRGNNTGYATA